MATRQFGIRRRWPMMHLEAHPEGTTDVSAETCALQTTPDGVPESGQVNLLS
jgi:hypothetical protein